MGRGERRCVRKGRSWFRRVTEIVNTREVVNKCVTKLKNRKAAGAEKIVNGFMKYGGEGLLIMMVIRRMLYNWMCKNAYAPKWRREGVVVNLFKKEDKADPATTEGNAIKHRRQSIL